MKLTILVAIFIVCVATTQTAYIEKSPVVTLKDFFENLVDNESRIISGKPASRGQFPWQVAVTVELEGERRGLCGGSLISPRWVLTAGHCIKGGRSWTVRLGSIDRNDQNEKGTIISKTTTAFKHENYNFFLHNDIALVKLNEDVPFNEYIQPIRLPSLSEVDNDLADIAVIVSGWGKTSDASNQASQFLNYVDLKTIPNEKCAKVYGKLIIINSTICTVGHPEHSTCNGDSGGPLIRIGEDGKPTQVGVVSFVHKKGCASGNPSGYVRTASFLDWIHEHTGIPIRP